MDFGTRVKTLRQAKNMTKEELCQDETELSVRQLTRIESGVSLPTLAKVHFIARRLGVTVGELADEKRFELPDRYKELKYLLLHTQTHMDPMKITLLENCFTEIFDDFYDELPEEEQLIIEVLNSQLELFLDNNNHYAAKKILSDYMEQTKKKETYQINDLILLSLYFHYLESHLYDPSLYDVNTHQGIIKNLLNISNQLPTRDIFFLNKVLIAACGFSNENFTTPTVAHIIDTLDQNIKKIQDLQNMPILNLIKWKYELYGKNNRQQAEAYFNEACLFAKLTQNENLAQRLQSEWEQDTK